MHIVKPDKNATEVRCAYCRLPPKTEWERLKSLNVIAETAGNINNEENWKENCRIWLGRQLLWYLLEVSSSDSAMPEIAYTNIGRPFIIGFPDFNITHAGDIVVVACTSRGRVGLDIELKHSVPFGQFTYVFSEEQMNSILEDDDPVTEFYRLWTVKESVVKLTGRDLSDVLDKLETDFKTATLGDESWYIEKLFIDQKHVCHLATDQPIAECVTEEIAFQKLLKVRYLQHPPM